MELTKRNHAAHSLGELADDFLFLFFVEKAVDSTGSRSTDWLAGHIIELALKAACLKVGVLRVVGHDLTPLFSRLQSVCPQGNVWPSRMHFDGVKTLFIRKSATEAILPPPETLEWVELAYWISNVGALKYGFDKDWDPVSNILVRYAEINSKFLALVRQLRSVYQIDALDSRLRQKTKKVFTSPGEEKKLHALLGI